MRSQRMSTLVAWLFGLTLIAACGVPRGGNNTVPPPEVGEQLYLQVTPDEAIALLRQIAPQSGWKMIRNGDQFDIRGQRGKYFWLEADKFVGGKRFMSGVFFNDPNGAFTVVGKRDSGFPEWLVQPMQQAIAEQRKQKGLPPSQPRAATPPPASAETATAQPPVPAPASASSGTVTAQPPPKAPMRSSTGIVPAQPPPSASVPSRAAGHP